MSKKQKSKLKPLTFQQAREIKKGSRYLLIKASYESKVGDVVKVTKADYPGSDYEHIRISNGYGSWRVASSDLSII